MKTLKFNLSRMMILGILLIIAVFMTMPAYADPHMSCDPQDGATKYRIELYEKDGQAITPIIKESPARADTTMFQDLANIPEGNYKGRAWGYAAEYQITNSEGEVSSVGGWSAPPAPFDLNIGGPGVITGLGLVE
jgi:hypothetical protein